MRRYITKGRIAALIAVLLVASVVLGFAPLVRAKARSTAERYGANVEIEWVVPTWEGVSLRGVRVTHPDAPSAEVELDRVLVSWGSPRKVAVDGGRLKLRGEVSDIVHQMEKVRGRMPEGEKSEGGSKTEISVARFDVDYSGPQGDLKLKDVKVARDGPKVTVTAEAGEGSTSLARGTLAQGSIEIDRSDGEVRVAKLSTEGLEVTANLGAIGGATSEPIESSSHEGRVARVRKQLAKVSELFAAHMTPEGSIDLKGVRADITRGTEHLSIGPATLRLGKKDGKLVGEYVAGKLPPPSIASTPPAGADGAPSDSLTIKAAFPRSDEPLAVEMHGGPVSFAALGLKDGEFHLTDVDRATFRANARFEIDPEGEVLSFDGEAQVVGLSATLPQIAKDPISGINASFRGNVRAALDGSKISVKGGELEVGRVRLNTTFDATLEPAKTPKEHPRLKLDLGFDVPLVPCQALLDAAPKGLLPTLAGMRLAGSIAVKGGAKLDTAKIDKDYDVRWDLSSTCRVTEAPPNVDVARFKKPFKRTVYRSTGEKNLEIETGPGTDHWARYSAISRYMELGIVSFEDGRFHRHEGFDVEAIKNSIRENLRSWQFKRGASTISMQLAKNLYLERDKRLARKIEEAFLTMYLEQALTKEQIVELYLNVVEFGPNVYGVADAAHHYFRTSASSLTLSQAFYLASILPDPSKEHFAAGGALSGGWLKFLRTVMKHANKLHRLTDEELEAGLAQIPVRGQPTPMRDPDAAEPAETPGEPKPDDVLPPN